MSADVLTPEELQARRERCAGCKKSWSGYGGVFCCARKVEHNVTTDLIHFRKHRKYLYVTEVDKCPLDETTKAA